MTDNTENLWITEQKVLKEGNNLFYIDVPEHVEPYNTHIKSKKLLFNTLQHKHGACSETLTIFHKGKEIKVGWKFSKPVKNDDLPEDVPCSIDVLVTVSRGYPKRLEY